MQGKTTRIVMFLILMKPICSFSMNDTLFKFGIGTGIFVVFTILVVLVYVLNEIAANKEIKK